MIMADFKMGFVRQQNKCFECGAGMHILLTSNEGDILILEWKTCEVFCLSAS